MPGARGSAIAQALLAVNASAFVTAVHADASPVLCSADIAGASLVQPNTGQDARRQLACEMSFYQGWLAKYS